MTKAELKTQIEKLQAEYDAMPDEVVLNGRADEGEYYYALDEYGCVIQDTESCHVIDDRRYASCNYYLSESVAQRAAAHYKKWGQFNRVAFELMEGEPEVDWSEKDRYKYCPYYCHEKSEWGVINHAAPVSEINHYFNNKEPAQRLADWANRNMPEG